MQTDVEERAASYVELAALDGRFVSDGDVPGSPCLADNPYGARSPRERRAIADGLPVHRLRWRADVHEHKSAESEGETRDVITVDGSTVTRDNRA